MERAEARLLDYLNEYPDRVVDLTKTLVRYNTAFLGPGSPIAQEKEAQEWIAGFLVDLDFQVDKWEPDVETLRKHPMYSEGLNWKDRPVTVGVLKGTGGGKSLILNGHLDTVAADPVERWTKDPWGGEIEGDRIYGRGSCDMKGGIACSLAVAEAVARSGVRLAGDLIVQVGGDEETTGMGTVAIIERGYKADACLVTEPSGFDIWTAYRGILYCTITVSGNPAHAEVVQRHWRAGGGVSAIEKMRLILDAIDDLNREWWERPDKRHGLLSNPKIIPTIIQGGEFVASYPGSCDLTMDMTYLPANADERGFGGRVRAEVEDHIRRAAEADPWLREHPPVFHWFSDYPAAETSTDSDIVRAVTQAAQAEGQTPRPVGVDSWTDAASYLLAGVPAICFGPGGLDQAHRIDEWVSVSELKTVTRAIARVVANWCGAG